MESKITKIEIQKRNKDRVNVYINEDYSFSCSSELVFSEGLKSDLVVDIGFLKNIVDEDNYLCAKNRALKLIEKSYKSEKEIMDKLVLKDYNEVTVNRVLNFLKSYNFVDDLKYVDLYIKEKSRTQGSKKIKYALIKKGISEKIIDEKLNTIPKELQIEAANNSAAKKLKVLLKTEISYTKIYSKLANFLVRLGFDNGIVKEVVTRLLIEIKSIKNGAGTEEKDNNKYTKDIYETAKKRYNILIKSEKDPVKLYTKLYGFLLRRGYTYEEIKKELEELVKID